MREGQGDLTLVYFDALTNELVLDRTDSGNPLFEGIYRSPLAPLADGSVTLQVFVDRNSVEVFANDGRAVLSALVFPDPSAIGVSFYAVGGTGQLLDFDAYELISIPHTPEPGAALALIATGGALLTRRRG